MYKNLALEDDTKQLNRTVLCTNIHVNIVRRVFRKSMTLQDIFASTLETNRLNVKNVANGEKHIVNVGFAALLYIVEKLWNRIHHLFALSCF